MRMGSTKPISPFVVSSKLAISVSHPWDVAAGAGSGGVPVVAVAGDAVMVVRSREVGYTSLEGVGDASGRSPAKLFRVGGDGGVSVRTTALWGGSALSGSRHDEHEARCILQ